MIKEKDILDKTHYGLNIYSHILRVYYPDEIEVHLSGKECSPSKNPFNENKLTLKLINVDRIFMYNDTELPDFKGNPFDFAELYYKLSGSELLDKLNEELYLHLGEQHHFYSNCTSPQQYKTEEVKPAVPAPKFSFFNAPVRNIYPKETLSLVQAYELIKLGKYSLITNQLRATQNKDEARKFKASQFDYVTFSGTFTKRTDKELIKHSGLLTVDFDLVPNIPELKQILLCDEYFETALLFISPSGDGLKWIIPIDISEVTHKEYFKAVSAYILNAYQIEVDNSGKDISRACFLPYDPEAYINPIYLNTPKL